MLISTSAKRKGVVTAAAVFTFVSLHQVGTVDLHETAQNSTADHAADQSTTRPTRGAPLAFTATAYCKGSVTASGVRPRSGVAASDPDLLPVGSVVDLETGDNRYDGIYSILDTGPAVQGRHVDLYMWSCYDALDFGRRPIQLTVLRLGWNPKGTSKRWAPTPVLVTDPD